MILNDDIDLLSYTIIRISNAVLLFTLVKKLYQQVRTKYEYKQVVYRWAIVRSFIPAWKGHSLSSASCCSCEAIHYRPTGRYEPLEFEVEWEVGRWHDWQNDIVWQMVPLWKLRHAMRARLQVECVIPQAEKNAGTRSCSSSWLHRPSRRHLRNVAQDFFLIFWIVVANSDCLTTCSRLAFR